MTVGSRRPGRVRPYHWLAVLPTIGLLGGVPFANRVQPFVLGLPFLLFWIVAWVVVTSAIMGAILLLDRDNHPDDAPGSTPAGAAERVG